MPPAVLVPAFDHPALEERYAHWQSQMLLRRDHGALHFYDESETASGAAAEVEQDHVLVVTDPLLLPSPPRASASACSASWATPSRRFPSPTTPPIRGRSSTSIRT